MAKLQLAQVIQDVLSLAFDDIPQLQGTVHCELLICHRVDHIMERFNLCFAAMHHLRQTLTPFQLPSC